MDTGGKVRGGGAGSSRRGNIQGAALLGAAAALALIALGCGKQEAESTAGTGEERVGAIAESRLTPVAAPASAIRQPEVTTGSATPVFGDSLPPDVQAFAPDSLVAPGGVVEITAQGSTDITELTLTDRLGQKYPFVYDSDAKGWRVSYRVPIGTHLAKLGLSVTATNGVHRWKRVWVFLKVEGGVGDEGSDGC